jgi:hypothetical protein
MGGKGSRNAAVPEGEPNNVPVPDLIIRNPKIRSYRRFRDTVSHRHQ